MADQVYPHELRAVSDAKPEGLALGLVRAWHLGDDALVKRLLARAVVSPAVGRAALLWLVDLVVPHQLDFDAAAVPEQRLLAGVVLARGSGLAGAVDELLAGADVVRLLVVAADLVDRLHGAGRLALPSVRFALVASS